MNVRIAKIFGREIIIQDEELVMPKYSKIKGVVREPTWLEYIICLVLISFESTYFI